MITGPAGAIEVTEAPSSFDYAFSVCTLVTRHDEYREMQESFLAAGFTPDDCQFLFADNSSGNRLDAFQAYQLFLGLSKAPYIILCHQDITLLEDGREKLNQIIAHLNDEHPLWGLFGNAGAKQDGSFCARITDPHWPNLKFGGPFPAQVCTLDENFIVVRRSANIGISRDLSGFHLYGADLCLIAQILGYSAYVVDFHLRHKSVGKKDASFFKSKKLFRRKYQAVFRSRWLPLATMVSVYLSGSPARSVVARVIRQAEQIVRPR